MEEKDKSLPDNQTEETPKEEPSLKEKIKTEVIEWTKSLFIAIVAAYLITHFLIMMCRVPTGSMEPTVMTGARLVVSRLNYKFSDPERGDIVTFYFPDDESTIYLKRIMGLPGETIEGVDGVIYINGEALTEDYTQEVFYDDFGPFTVPEDCYFMMGDNRNSSLDSRYWENTFVKREKIIGQAVLEFLPKFQLLTDTETYPVE